jgi:hypothetical protein
VQATRRVDGGRHRIQIETAPAAPSHRDEGTALLTSMLVLVLMVGITAGLTALVITDTRVRSLDGTRTQSFYAAHAGLERLTADLGDLFRTNFAPTGAQVNAIAATGPALGVQWLEPNGGDGYTITFPADGAGNPVSAVSTVNAGPFQGLVGLATQYQMRVTARLPDRSEASLTRALQTVAIPVFQFGIFSENDLSFFAGPNFNFGGRVHTNENLFLAEGNGNTLTLADRVTAVGEIIRTNLSNGWATSTNYTGTVRAITAPATFRPLAPSEGSLVGTLGSALNDPTWTNLSESTYNFNIRNGRTGARRLDLPITAFGAGPIDLIRRPAVNENVTAPAILAERFFSMASLRILLSDTAADITSLPTVTATAPIELGINEPAGYVISDVPPRPHFAQTPNAATAGLRTPFNTPLLGGFIKIEQQTAPGVWVDVTLQILSLGFNSRQYWNVNPGAGSMCPETTPDAIIRFQRPYDTTSVAGEPAPGGANGCFTTQQVTTSGWAINRLVPNVLYDPREALRRDTAPASMNFSGIFHYIELDARNLSRWFNGTMPAGNCSPACTGFNSLNVNGYTVYFSDRRGNRDAANNETGEFGFEDIVNPASGTGTPNNTLNTGEDFNGNGTLETYGRLARSPYGVAAFAGMAAPLQAATLVWDEVGAANQYEIARRNPLIFFRRALKITNGSLGNLVAPGLTIAAENPTYLQGNWNANNAGFGNPHVATAIIADAVTLLSNDWNDRNSLVYHNQHDTNIERHASDTWYRAAIISGKGIAFPQPAGTPQDFGTDGGAHNFLRYIENWAGHQLNFRGSIVSFFRSRQGTGTYKCCTIVYSPPTRGYNFDTEFLTPALLPPRTPMFRDVNLTGFAQIIRPN